MRMKPNPMYYSADHIAFADTIRKFTAQEITPYVNAWDEAETFRCVLYPAGIG